MGNRTNVTITCSIHGDFSQSPKNHLNGFGCKFCAPKRDIKASGIGIFDYKKNIHRNTLEYITYSKWYSMIKRCYNEEELRKHPSYIDCTVCDEWLYFSNFKKWFDENYIEGYQLDKDILVKGNKVYSPETCCFVPLEINILFTKRQNQRGLYPIGVSKRGSLYLSNIQKNGLRCRIGSFNTPIEAFNAYKSAKEQYIKELAEQYFNEGKITKRVYDALMKYEVEITD